MASKLGRMLTYLNGLHYILIMIVFMVTKLIKLMTYHEGLLTIMLLHPFARSREKLKPLYLHYHDI